MENSPQVRQIKVYIGFLISQLPQVSNATHAEIAIALAELHQEFSAIARQASGRE